ncbi:hydroxymethylbilane synthase [Fluoribacter dumoffii]|nr:hydroxymethylbilane synthase [Fluoribacter dumoffii]MCW8387127.1 hydroxymethylbilane synthase [Fluoribacter dumoffii]MCW8417369.1 hydroxymethylbilane synthase [Fluoribacter dumoffii]MCW8454790.1 hydroxymethylbilane synthase [Fluoribacter dumoffii]MCW8461133.1 hydroxymethylbilane synthase [Fluoribacter dumoffii]MCW8484574.1 hydroxymethylbilane synthase [Fluoribacter dumoffii]
MRSRILRIATRQSPLALWQANHVRDLLLKKHPNLQIELLPMSTSGDKFLRDKLQAIGGKGLFVKELEEALLDKRADFAVHSSKDMPAEFPEGLELVAICKRDNPFDVFVSFQYPNLQALPAQAVVGTSSLRRQSQLLAYRPDLGVKSLRGNIHTRLEKLKTGEYQAIILAAAGLERMGFTDIISEQLSEQIMLPACGQGALALECRNDDQEIRELLAELNDPISSICVNAERRVNALLGGNCHVPLAVFCTPTEGNQLSLRAKILTLDGAQLIQSMQLGPLEQALSMADHCAQSLLSQGAASLLASVPK